MVEFTPHFSSETSDDDESDEEKAKKAKEKKQSVASFFRSLSLDKEAKAEPENDTTDEKVVNKPISDLGALLTGAPASEQDSQEEQPINMSDQVLDKDISGEPELRLEDLSTEMADIDVIGSAGVEADVPDEEVVEQTDVLETPMDIAYDAEPDDDEVPEVNNRHTRIATAISRPIQHSFSRPTIQMSPRLQPLPNSVNISVVRPQPGNEQIGSLERTDSSVINLPKTPEAHEYHDHTHPLMAALLGGGLLLENIFRKRADRRLDREFNQSLREQKQEYEEKYNYLLHEQSISKDREGFLNRSVEVLKKSQHSIDHIPNAPTRNEFIDNRLNKQSIEHTDGFITTEKFDTKSSVNEVIHENEIEQVIESVIKPPERLAHNIVYEQSVEAAQKNAAVEKEYERRSEIKDDPSANNNQGMGVSQSTSRQPSQTLADGLQMAQNQATLQSFKDTQEQKAVYKTAMSWGFAVATAIVVFAIVAYIWTR